MIKAMRFMSLAWKAYWQAQKTGRTTYSALTWHGVPQACLIVGVGREAWKVTMRAINDFEEVK